MQFNGPSYNQLDTNLIPEEHVRIYGDPDKIIQFMDYTNGGPPDNSRYVPKLVPGILQPLEELSDTETDNFLSTIDIEALIKEAENSTGRLPPPPPPKDLNHFRNPIPQEKM